MKSKLDLGHLLNLFLSENTDRWGDFPKNFIPALYTPQDGQSSLEGLMAGLQGHFFLLTLQNDFGRAIVLVRRR